MSLTIFRGDKVLILPATDGSDFLTATTAPDPVHPDRVVLKLSPHFACNCGKKMQACGLLPGNLHIAGAFLSLNRQFQGLLKFCLCGSQTVADFYFAAELSPALMLELAYQDDFIKNIFKKARQAS